MDTTDPGRGRRSRPAARAPLPRERTRGISFTMVKARMEAHGLDVSPVGTSLLIGRGTSVYVSARKHPRGGWSLANARERNQVTRASLARTGADLDRYLSEVVGSPAPAAAAGPEPGA